MAHMYQTPKTQVTGKEKEKGGFWFVTQDSTQVLASVRTNSRPPVYFFGDSLGLLGVGEGRQKETIEASLVFEEEEEGETNKVFENKEEEEEFKKNQDIFSVGEDETKNFDEEQNNGAIRKRTKSLGEELMEGKREEMRETSNATTGRENLDVCPRCPGRPPSSGLQGTDQPPGQIISTSLLPSPHSPQPLIPVPLILTNIVETSNQTSPQPPPAQNNEPSVPTQPHLPSSISGLCVKPRHVPEESGNSLTREQIIELFTNKNSPDQSLV